MRVVVDTNVLVSGVFFHGAPSRVVQAILGGEVDAFATNEIVDEYREVVARMLDKRMGRFDQGSFDAFARLLGHVDPRTHVKVCRDPDDDKFIGCALDARALYVVSGDKDLLDLGEHQGVTMITAAEFCERYL